MAVGYSTREVAKLVNLSPGRIRAYARAGLVGTGQRPFSFDFRDLLVLRMAGKLLASGLPSYKVQRALSALHKRVAAEKPLSGTQLLNDCGRVVASDGSIHWDPESGQCLLRFGTRRVCPASSSGLSGPLSLPRVSPMVAPKAADEVALSLANPATAESADACFDRALVLEDDSPQEAYDLYLAALAADPEHVEATINIGRLCSANGDARRATAYFRQAVRLDGAHPVAHFNLAVTLHDMGDLVGAMDAYGIALLHDPHFADAHYNLATLLEQQGDTEEALRHFHAYRTVSRELQK